jgi:hypothetical protein
MNNDISPSDDHTLDEAIQQARRELHEFQQQRQEEHYIWHQELQHSKIALKNVQKQFREKFASSPRAFYMTCLKHVNIKDTPMYVSKQQMTLLMAIHSNFKILPNQTKKLEQYREEMTDYLQEQIRQLQDEGEVLTEEHLQRLSLVAEHNNDRYDAYQDQLDYQQGEIRRISLQLPKETNDDSTIVESLSDSSEHSFDNYDANMSSKLLHEQANDLPLPTVSYFRILVGKIPSV